MQEVPGKRFKGEDTWVIGRNGKTNSSRAFTWTPGISFTLVFGLDSDLRSVLCQFQWLLLSIIRQHGGSKRRLGLGVRKNGQFWFIFIVLMSFLKAFPFIFKSDLAYDVNYMIGDIAKTTTPRCANILSKVTLQLLHPKVESFPPP